MKQIELNDEQYSSLQCIRIGLLFIQIYFMFFARMWIIGSIFMLMILSVPLFFKHKKKNKSKSNYVECEKHG